MAKKLISLGYKEVGVPLFKIPPKAMTASSENYTLFDLTSHFRARQAIEFGLKMRCCGANIFIISGDLRGRMTSTLNYLESYISNLPPPLDWVYLNNFLSIHRPIPFGLEAGKGTRLKELMKELIDSATIIFKELFDSPAYQREVAEMQEKMEEEINAQVSKIENFAATKGLKLENEGDDINILVIEEETEEAKFTPQDVQYIKDQLATISSKARIKGQEWRRQVTALKKNKAQVILNALMVSLYEEFDDVLKEWLGALKEDILNHLEYFIGDSENDEVNSFISGRYAVNLLVDNRDSTAPQMLVDPSPTYESLFGSIKYHAGQNGYVTDFTLIRAGNLHRANGGILVLRAEAVAKDSELWGAIKTALRDRAIRIEERYRENSMPMLDAPEPEPIPLDVQIVLVGAPQWYYKCFFHDPEFRNHFKIKADIEPDFEPTPENIHVVTHLIRNMTESSLGRKITKEALQYLMGWSTRWSNNRKRLSSKMELLWESILEAHHYGARENAHENNTPIDVDLIRRSLEERRFRNSGIEDRSQREFQEKALLIETSGYGVGYVNALTVLSVGDHEFGMPNRITARTYAGNGGVINIERLTEMGGPIQQKGALIIDGLLKGLFAQERAITCSCSITFEQNYGMVEGDSATLAEMLAILSALSGVPARQDIAITGSLNQFGEVQAVGGVNHKIEGFFTLCAKRGLTGTQGVIIPESNINQVVLREPVVEAVRDGKFFVWPVKTLEEALFHVLEKEPGVLSKRGTYPKDSIFGLVACRLKKYGRFTSQK